MLTLISGIIAAALFAAAGWLGALLSEALYGTLTPEADGPAAIEVPVWAFAAAPAVIGFFVGFQGDQPLHIAIFLIAVLSLTACAATDFRAGMIPDLFSVGPLLVVLALAAVQHDWAPPVGALFAFVPFALLALFSRGRGMGWGDVKLATLGGALVGMTGITLAVALASVAAFIVGRTGGRARQAIAFGPYLAASIGAALAVGSTF
jgi:prepilin signal peptidase PulO-like enzyme (type II secretory pathway)